MHDALNRLRSRIAALPDPGFSTLIAPRGDFGSARRHRTAFFGAMTLRALQADIGQDLSETRARLAEALRQERGAVGSWNYWMRASEEAAARPLPDDLDTTSCALMALADEPGGLPMEWVARFVGLLTLRETALGGPYRTWIAPSDADAAWQDVDPVVNANIGGFLSRYGAVPVPLLAFLAEAVRDRSRTSPYYSGRSAFRSALARWYRGDALPELEVECDEALRTAISGTSLHELATALSCAASLDGCDEALIREGFERLLELCRTSNLTAEAGCIDAVHGGVADLAGSEGFTAALALEALIVAKRRMSKPVPTPSPHEALMTAVAAAARAACTTFSEPLKSEATAAVETMLAADTRGDVTAFPFVVASAALGTLAEAPSDIGAAHALGWTAFTRHDDIADGDTPPVDVWTANALLRRAYETFQGLFSDDGWKERCRSAFDRMDAANLEEGAWQLARDGDGWKLPDAIPPSSLASLTGRSVGILLAPTAVVLRTAPADAATLIADVEGFLLHVIAARQLCDDAHDWEDDLRHGRLNHASVGLFAPSRVGTRLDIAHEMDALREAFWETRIQELLADVEAHVRQAERHLQHFRGDARALSERVLRPLPASLARAVRERDETKSFLKAYHGERAAG